MKKLLLFILICSLFSSFAYGICSVTFDQDQATNYSATESISADQVCTGAEEKSDVYTLTWRNCTNGDGTVLETDIGTTPSTAGQHFFETYTIPIGYTGCINATMTGSQQEGNDTAYVSGASASSLLITGITIGGKWLGLVTNVQGIVKDENGYAITGGECEIDILNNDATEHLITIETKMTNGEVRGVVVLNYRAFAESRDYVTEIHCFCGSTGSDIECIDGNDGSAVTNSEGLAQQPFTTNKWITFQEEPFPIIYSNGTDYVNPILNAGLDEVYWRRNSTNNYGEVLKTMVSTYLVDNSTGSIYGIANEGSDEIFERSFQSGNSTNYFNHLINKFAPSGVYKIRLFFEVFFNNIEVAQYIVDSETFNVTGGELTMKSVVTNKGNYYSGEQLFVCANISNTFNDRLEVTMEYSYRCSDNGLDFDTDRVLLGFFKEMRGINANDAQYQCSAFVIPNDPHFASQDLICYGSATMISGFIDNVENRILKTSSAFNLTQLTFPIEIEADPNYPIIRAYPDWRFFDQVIDSKDRNYYRAKLNITRVYESSIDYSDKIVDNDWDLYAMFGDGMQCLDNVYNYTVLDSSGVIIDNELEIKSMQWEQELDHNEFEIREGCGLGIENINFSDTDDDYFEVRVWYEGFEERSTEAFEDIANKTGTFKLSIDCPPQGLIDDPMTCLITAQIESGEVQKEVDFTCYILQNGNRYSSLNFNQMVTATPVTLEKDFLVPSHFTGDTIATLYCEAGYYNLGSRIDTFYDTFVAEEPVVEEGVEGGVVGVEEAIVNDTANLTVTQALIEELEEDEKRSNFFLPVAILCGAFIIILIITMIIYIEKRSKKEDKQPTPQT